MRPGNPSQPGGAGPSATSAVAPNPTNAKRKINADKLRHRAVHGRLSNEFKVGMRSDATQDVPVPLPPTFTEVFHKKMAQVRRPLPPSAFRPL